MYIYVIYIYIYIYILGVCIIQVHICMYIIYTLHINIYDRMFLSCHERVLQ